MSTCKKFQTRRKKNAAIVAADGEDVSAYVRYSTPTAAHVRAVPPNFCQIFTPLLPLSSSSTPTFVFVSYSASWGATLQRDPVFISSPEVSDACFCLFFFVCCLNLWKCMQNDCCIFYFHLPLFYCPVSLLVYVEC